MGLFDKKYCDVCGEKIGLLGNRKLEDGNLCKDCAKKLSPWFNERRHSSVDEIKAQLAYREENKEKVSNFRVTRKIGENRNVLFDDTHRQLTVTRAASPSTDENPDILDYSDITAYRFDIDEDKSEIYRKDSEGKNVSYNPPRYEYSYNFDFVINVNNPYFDEIKFRMNSKTVEYTPEPTVQISLFGRSLTDNSVNPENCSEYCKYRDMCRELCDELDRIRGMGTAQMTKLDQAAQTPAAAAASATAAAAAASAAADSGAWSCANCGAQNTGKFCESCGTPRPAARAASCPSCGWTPTPGQPMPKFCPECGRGLPQ